MKHPIPIETETALALWARLVIIEQCSMAIVERSFPRHESVRLTRQTRCRIAKEETPHHEAYALAIGAQA
jgi:hypothetical protein